MIALLLLPLALANCEQPSQGFHRIADDSVYARIIRGAVESGVPGVQAYVRHGLLEWCMASGLASVEQRRPMTLNDRVRVASITKMMTYATVMELVKSGRLNVTDRAVDRMPARSLDGVPHAAEITVAQLLDHTSGLHNFNGRDGADFFAALFNDPNRGSRRWTPRELIAFARDPQHAPTGRPGERRAYSSTGFSVLEVILEHIQREAFGTLFRVHLFGPLGMTRSAVEGWDLHADSIASSYAVPAATDLSAPSPFGARKAVRPDGLVNLSAGLDHYNSWAGAAGAVATNVTDLAKFMSAVSAGDRIVLRDQAEELARVGARTNGYLAWNGGSWGIQASILYEPGRDITVIVLSNASNAGDDTQSIARKLLLAARQ